jgi:hypothetical protein
MTLCSGFSVTETVYLLRDNPVSIIPYSDYDSRINWDMSTTTNVLVSVDDITSTTSGDAIQVTSETYPTLVKYLQNGNGDWAIHMLIGMFPALTVGEKSVRVIIYDTLNTNGVVVVDKLLISVVGPQ